MSRFTSRREKRLWAGAFVVLTAIYSTLGLAGTLAEVLRARALLDTTAFGAFVVVVLAIAWSGIRTRPAVGEVWVALAIGAVYVMAVARMSIGPVERTHLFEYGVVAVLIHEALMERSGNGRHVYHPAVLAIIATALLGWLDEGIQAVLPNRVYDLRDVGVNALAALMAVGATSLLRYTRAWIGARSD